MKVKAFKVLDIDWNKKKTSARFFDQVGGFRYIPNETIIYNKDTMFSRFNAFYAFPTLEIAKENAKTIIPDDGKTIVLAVELTDPESNILNGKYQVLVSKELKLIWV